MADGSGGSINVEELTLQISSDSAGASQALDSLAQSLKGLRNATTGLSGFSKFSKNISDLKTSLSGMGSFDSQGVKNFASALTSLNGIKVSSTIAKQISAISQAVGSISPSASSKMKAFVDSFMPLQYMGKTNLNSILNSLKKIPDIFNQLNSIDIGALGAKIKEVADALRPLADQMAKISAGFSAFPSKLQKITNQTNAFNGATKKSSFSLVNFAIKLRYAYFAIRGVAGGIARAIHEINRYIENLNLFNVSMGEYAKEAMKYANTVGEAMGIDPSAWIRNQGIFMTLTKGFGVASDRAYLMSKNLTQLGYDLSSFFNISVGEAMQKLQSGISGELEPLTLAA